jgi:predicted transcriptional regulator of viral defense system
MGRNSAPGRESPQGPDAEIARIAGREHGNITRAQLHRLGLTDDAIAHRVASGRLYRVHRGVYAVGRPPVVALEHAAAAVLACGPHAGLSHTSGLALWELRNVWELPQHVTVTEGDPRPRASPSTAAAPSRVAI